MVVEVDVLSVVDVVDSVVVAEKYDFFQHDIIYHPVMQLRFCSMKERK